MQILATVRSLAVKAVVCLLVLCWPVMSSHALLHQMGAIHEVHSHHHHDGHHGSHEHDSQHDDSHEHRAENHSFADGDCLHTWTKPISVKGHLLLFGAVADLWSPVSDAVSSSVPTVFGPSPPGGGPPELASCWQFHFRLALPARAPSPLV